MAQMNRPRWLNNGLWMLAVSSLLVVACEKSDTPNEPDDVAQNSSVTRTAATASIPFDDASAIAEIAVDGNYSGKSSQLFACATVTIDSASSGFVEVTVDFGNGCTDANGNVRTGSFVATFTRPRWAGGATTDIEFINYTVNQVEIEGTYHHTFLGLNSSNQPEWDVEIDGSAIYSPGDTLYYMSNRTRTWTNGFMPFNPNAIEFSVTGTAQGERTNQPAWTATTLSPLVWAFGCPWLVSGEYELSVTGYPLYTIDFGNGTCDNIATITGNGATVQISL